MSIPRVTTANTHPIPHQINIENLRAGPTATGSSTASSMSPATPANPAPPAASSGFCASISAWVSSVVEGVRNCLAKLPLVGGIFGPATTPPNPPPAIDPKVAADARLITVIESIFQVTPPATAGAAATAAPAEPAADLKVFARSQFTALQTPAAKWQAFGIILNAANGTDPIAKEFYDALPADMQNAFKGEMYRVHGSSNFNGHDHGDGFGDFMVHGPTIRQNVAKTAVANLQAAASVPAAPATP